MQLKNYFALGLLGVTLLSSCNKDEDLKGDNGVSTGKREVFTASISEVETFDLLEYGADEHEARASITSKGYAVPRLEVSLAELADGSTQAHWGVLGHNRTPDEESVPNTKVTTTEPENLPTESTLFFKASTKPNDKNELKFYCPVSDDLNSTSSPVTNKWAYFAVGGVRNGQYLEFNKAHHTSPNARIVGITKDKTQTARQIPLMTEVMSFKKILGEDKETVTLNPRGCLIGLCFVNKFEQDITIKELIVPRYNALYFEGKFDMQKSSGNRTVDFKASTCTDNNEQTKFDVKAIEGKEEPYTFPVFADNTAIETGYSLAKVTGSFASEKDNLPLFHIWGMPRTSGCGEDRLSFRVRFTKKVGTETKEFTTRMFSITLPKNSAFEEGKAYRLPITLNEKALPNTFGTNDNPLKHIAEHAVRKDGQALITDYHINPSTNYQHWGYQTDIGFYNWFQARAIFHPSRPLSKDYYFPNIYQWQSIVPYQRNRFLVNFFRAQGILTLREAAQVGQTQRRNYDSEYLTVAECPDYVTYALRFKGTDYESAWRYSYDKEKRAAIVQCLGGFRDSGKKLKEFAYPEFFSDNPVTVVRVFPSYGAIVPERPNLVKTLYSNSMIWTSSPHPYKGFISMSSAFGYKSGGCYENGRNFFLAVYPFKKNP